MTADSVGFAIPQNEKVVAAIDVGGTRIKGALLSQNKLLQSIVVPTPIQAGPETVLTAVLDAVQSLVTVAGQTKVDAIGLVVPGIVDETAGVVTHAKNLGWTDLPLVQKVSDRFGLPVGFGHDVRAGALAEYRLGAGRGADEMVFVAVGTGIASAIVHGGQILANGGSAGEVGHGSAATGELCVCGGRGCLETYASASGISRQYSQLSGKAVGGAVEVLELVQAGDLQASFVWDQAVAGLADLMSQIVRILGEVRIVVGGGLSLAGPALFDPLIKATATRLPIQPLPEIVPSMFLDKSAIYGAALLAWDGCFSSTESGEDLFQVRRL